MSCSSQIHGSARLTDAIIGPFRQVAHEYTGIAVIGLAGFIGAAMLGLAGIQTTLVVLRRELPAHRKAVAKEARADSLRIVGPAARLVPPVLLADGPMSASATCGESPGPKPAHSISTGRAGPAIGTLPVSAARGLRHRLVRAGFPVDAHSSSSSSSSSSSLSSSTGAAVPGM